ncbi:TetR/AcrR family transcriptional regulator [Pediococcus siamensis]|uniref:TetR/AcrR family transcriptional regulator n=1 Tax=Pediococcus siamensis TaxID=381829 RepID=UPI00399F322B
MPKATFFNLNAAKKSRLMAAAQREFSRASLADVSVSAIVTDAQIPRGSFYQYFEDKEDLYFYYLGTLVTGIERHLLDLVQETHGDLFVSMNRFFDYAVGEIMEGPNAAIFKNDVATNFQRARNAGQFEKKRGSYPFFKSMREIEDKISQSVDRSQLRFQNDDELKALQRLVFMMLMHTIGHYLHTQKEDAPQSLTAARTEFITMLNWLANGALKSKKELS